MFDYESLAGQAVIKDKYMRLQSYEWTNNGIKLIIADIDKKTDPGKYEGDVEIGEEYKPKTIEVKEIFGQ